MRVGNGGGLSWDGKLGRTGNEGHEGGAVDRKARHGSVWVPLFSQLEFLLCKERKRRKERCDRAADGCRVKKRSKEKEIRRPKRLIFGLEGRRKKSSLDRPPNRRTSSTLKVVRDLETSTCRDGGETLEDDKTGAPHTISWSGVGCGIELRVGFQVPQGCDTGRMRLPAPQNLPRSPPVFPHAAYRGHLSASPQRSPGAGRWDTTCCYTTVHVRYVVSQRGGAA